MLSQLHSQLDKWFLLTERSTDVKTEFIAGFVCFVANAYQLVLIPTIMNNNDLGLDQDIYLFAFCVSTAVSSSIVGLLSNLPLPAGVGIGCSTYFAYSLTLRESNYDEREVHKRQVYGSTICFVASGLMTLLAVAGVQWWLFRKIPFCVKDAMPVGLGLLLALEGFQQMKLVVNGDGMLKTGPITFSVVMGATGCVLTTFLHHHQFKSAVLVPMVLITLVGWAAGKDGFDVHGVHAPTPKFGDWLSMWNDFDHQYVSFEGFEIMSAVIPSVSLYLISLFDVGGITYAVASSAGLVVDKGTDKERLPGAYGVFIACGVGSMVAAVFGCSPVIALGESFAGVAVGGRTGLTAIVNAFFFALALPLAPLFSAVPDFASAPVLVLLGVDLLSLTKFLDLDDATKALPSFCTIALMPYLYSIDHAIIAGLVAYWLLALLGWAADTYEGCCGTGSKIRKDAPLLLGDEEKADIVIASAAEPPRDDDQRSTTSSHRAYVERTGIVVGYEEYYESRKGGYLVGGGPKKSSEESGAPADDSLGARN
ncbi:hypothetical protein CTAYLR_003418 [Chrysophaeum taylorii]|uniref:Xanthine/uracil/vitamin C permease n=1 Tax=Chrysophaeum taylorii TaxID=2483200 RepID=A0AAD7U8E5_9STRA|nr:hypothetical protein CTAYLR_003418 [Chrysophaeum taylorii]